MPALETVAGFCIPIGPLRHRILSPQPQSMAGRPVPFEVSMSAEIIQFVPKANPNRPSMVEAEENKAADFLCAAPALMRSGDTAPSEYCANDGGCV